MEMEDVMRRAGHEGLPKEERWVDCAEGDGGYREEVAAAKVGSEIAYYENDDDRKSSSPEHADLSKQQATATTKKERFNLEPDSKASSSSRKEQDHQLESARAEMGEATEENHRLKMYLDRIMKDYRTLQMQFYGVIQHEETKRTTDDTVADDHQGNEESELISLTLGRCSSEPKRDAKNKVKDQLEQVKEGPLLGLNCTSFDISKSDANETLPNPSPMNSFEEQKEEVGQPWPPSKVIKTTRNGDNDEVAQQNPVKKARVSVRARCDTTTMNDGCQWRKYGQKIAKGNPCPRAYYRCTVAPLCPVRKQVQRCPEDMSILVTTYEGKHNHPLPISATAMASTTSAAASMLLSGPNPSSSSSTIHADLHGLSYYSSDNSNSKPFYLHNSSSLSSSSPYASITLDLTSNLSSSSSSSSSSHFNRNSSSYPTIRKLASTSCINFGASNPSNAISWGNGFLPYGGTTSQSYNRNQFGKLNPPVSTSQQFVLPADTIAAATKAITTDPSFQSALTAALNSILRSGNSTGGANLGALKWGDRFPVANSLPSASIAKGSPCATGYLNNTNSTSSQVGSLMFVPPSLPFSTTPTSASASPTDNEDRSR